MSRHDCPFCECDGRLWNCRYCHQTFIEDGEDWYNGCCSLECSEALDQRSRQWAWDQAVAKRAKRLEAGKDVCRAHTRDGRLCNGNPIRGAGLCSSHADEDVRDAHDYGRELGELAVNDDLAAALAAGRPWFPVIDANRRAVILTELQRQLVESVGG